MTAIALGTTCLSFAQTSTATILGVVKDTSAALVPGVSITVKHTESGLTRTVVSGEERQSRGLKTSMPPRCTTALMSRTPWLFEMISVDAPCGCR